MRSLVTIGRALGAPARVAMLDVLFDGMGHTAGELALAADVAPSTASAHLTALVDAELVRVEQEGRRRYYRLADRDVASALEHLGGTSTGDGPSSLRASREHKRVRQVRTCYDHLAGRLGVALAQHAVANRWTPDSMDTLLPDGRRACRDRFGFDPNSGRRRTLVRPCLDWTEKRPHLAGAFAGAMAETFLLNEWVLRRPGSRGLVLTNAGAHVLAEMGVDLRARSQEVAGTAPA